MGRFGLIRATGLAAVLLLGVFTALLTAPAGADPFGWQPPTHIDAGTKGSAGHPDVAFDADGNAVVAWTQSGMVFAKRIAPDGGGGWVLIGSHGSLPQVAVDPTGTAIVVWSHNGTIWASAYPLNSGPSPPASIGGMGGDAGEPQVVIDSTGRAVVVWIEYDGPTKDIWAAQFSPVQGWDIPILIEEETDPVFSVQIAANQMGDAIVAVWQHRGRIGANWYLSDAGWGVPTYIPREGFFFVGLSSSIEAVLLFDGGSTFGPLTAIHLSQDGSWDEPVVIEMRPSDSLEFRKRGTFYAPHAAMDATGNVSIVWCVHHDCWDVWTIRYVPGTGFASPTLLAESPYHLPARIAVDPQGRTAFVTWNEFGLLWASRLLPDGDWDDPALLANPAGGLYPQMEVGPTGDAFAVWTQREGDQWRMVASRHVSDFSPPSLELSSPADGVTTSFQTVILTGWTEPGAKLVANGIVPSVAADGSFSFPLALSEGTNVITVIAEDEAGNSATATVRVTYVNPLPLMEERQRDANDALTETRDNLDSSNAALASAEARVSLLLFLQVALVASVALLFVMYWNQRRGGPGMGGNPRGPEGPHPTEGPRKGPRGGSAHPAQEVLSPEPGEDRPWPRVSPASPVYLTAKERVVLHLLDNAKYGDAREVPPELTQGGIAKSAGFPRRHFSQYVRPLLGEGLVEQRNAPVEGILQRQKVYALSYDGWRKALGIRDRIQSVAVSARYVSGERKALLGDLLADMHGARSILEVLREFLENGRVDLRN